MLQTYNAGDGTVGTVIWLDDNHQPVEPEQATSARITFSDGESVVFEVERPEPRAAEFVEEEHPRDEAGKFTDKASSSKVLTSGKVKSSEKIDGSINHVEKVVLVDDEGHSTEAIFKPVYGESWTGGEQARRQFEETYGVEPESELGQHIIAADYDDPMIQQYPAFDPDDYGDFEDDAPVRDSITNRDFTYADREAAAYEVDQALGLNVIPPTTVRGIDGVKGMVQQYAEPDDRQNLSKVDPDSVYGAAVLDIVTGNTDRHFGNYLISNGRFVAIDQGLTFPDGDNEFRPDAVVDALAAIGKERMTPDFAERVKQKLEKTDWEGLTQKWAISSAEKRSFFSRLSKLREAFDEYDSPEDGIKQVLRDMTVESTIAGGIPWR